MKPVALISVDTNPNYLSCVPIVCKSWELQGFNVDLTIVGNSGHNGKLIAAVINHCTNAFITLENNQEFSDVNPALYTQCIRLYKPLAFENDQVFVLSDADMFIGSSFLHRDFDKLNSFGHDLTGYGEIPMCYVSGTAAIWKEVMGSDCSMQDDLQRYSQFKSTDWYQAWGADQQILTAKLQAYGYHRINFINRGHDSRNSGLPLGRWDRYNWVMPTSEIHDVHLMRNPLSDENFPTLLAMCETLYPGENWEWLWDYKKEFNEAL